jgi:hypothetical protein
MDSQLRAITIIFCLAAAAAFAALVCVLISISDDWQKGHENDYEE